MPLISTISQSLKAKLPAGLTRDSLKARVFRGGVWLGAGSLTEQVFRFTRNMILTRLLAPEAFGIMAIIQSTTAIIQCLTEVGVKEGLIQNPNGDKEEYIGAAWWVAFVRSLSIYAMLFAAAPFAAHFYGNPELRGLLRVATLGMIFEGAISTKAYVALKHMKFSRWAIVNHGGARHEHARDRRAAHRAAESIRSGRPDARKAQCPCGRAHCAPPCASAR